MTDSASTLPLASANVRVLGTSRGTITNGEGRFRLPLEPSDSAVRISYLGFRPETLRVAPAADVERDVRLVPSPVQIAQVFAIAEDPAIGIIRKAIANKRRWMDKLSSYRFEAFTRQVLRKDTSIAGITEAYTTGTMAAGDTLREVVRQKRQTLNIPVDENFASVGRIVNFNDDEIRLFRVNVNGRESGYTFTGPTAPEALEVYDYKLLRTRRVGGIDQYAIRMTPKTRLRPLFDGVITIAGGTFAVMGVDVRPNETLNMPFVKDIELRFSQQFSLYNDTFWMPTDVRMGGSLSISIVGFSLPRIGIEQTSAVTSYEINVPVPDSLRSGPRLRVDSAAAAYDSAFWDRTNVLPLTPEEQTAYRSLDSAQSLEKQFRPSGPLTGLGEGAAGGLLDILDARFNRVEGFAFGGSFRSIPAAPYIRLRASAGWAFSAAREEWNLGATIYTSPSRKAGAGFDIYRETGHVPDGNFYGPAAISLMALIDKNDYGDYYFTSGWRARAVFAPSHSFHAEAGFTNEREFSMENATDYSFFAGDRRFRDNPPITDGVMHSLNAVVDVGGEADPFGLVSRDAARISVEQTLASGEFDFTRASGLLQWNFPTFARGLLFPPTLRIGASAGWSSGTLPPQRAFVPDTRASGYAPFGVLKGAGVREFAGDRFVMLTLEHNFRSVPFLALDLPFLYRNGIELVVHGAAAQTWSGTLSTSRGWYGEAGIGISRILDLLRADVTYRLTSPRRFFFSMSLANLF